MLPKKYRLTRNQDFRRVYRKGRSVAYPLFVLYSRKNGQKIFRIGFSVSKKVGKANKRNLVKRRFREAARNQIINFCHGHDYIFIVRNKATEATYSQIYNQMSKALESRTSLNR
jgi:ribonuclease P protein component